MTMHFDTILVVHVPGPLQELQACVCSYLSDLSQSLPHFFVEVLIEL